MASRKKRAEIRRAAEEEKAARRGRALQQEAAQEKQDHALRREFSRQKLGLAFQAEALLEKADSHEGYDLRNKLGLSPWQLSKERMERMHGLLLLTEKRFSDTDYIRALWAFTDQAWIRPLERWKPQGKSKERQFRSLASHLLCNYPLPQFLYQVFFYDTGRRDRAVELFCYLGTGGSLYKATRREESAALIPTLSRKMCHYFLETRGLVSMEGAVRGAQVRAYGGDRRMADALGGTSLGRQFFPAREEEFWDTGIHWFCNQNMLDPSQIGPMVDYFSFCRRQDPHFSLKGRTVVSTMRGMEDWHKEMHRIAKVRKHEYAPSGFRGGHWEFPKTTWDVREILDLKELSAEGRTMGHCVVSYGNNISNGRISIWSLKQDGERKLTIEVINNRRAIVQCRGKFNRMPTPQEDSMVQRWAMEAGLTVGANRMW